MASFSLFGIPVAVRASFLLMVLVLGYLWNMNTVALMVAWALIVFFSVLIHELGHALVARGFGAEVEMELNGLGGLTRWGIANGDLTPGKRALIAAAGSGFGLIFGGLVWVIATQVVTLPPFGREVASLLVYVNVFWGLLNWLPIRPLDGGHLVISLLEKVTPKRADAVARVVFSISSGLALFFAFRYDFIFLAVFAGWMLISELAPRRPKRATPPVVPERFAYDDRAEQPPPFGYDDPPTRPADPEPPEEPRLHEPWQYPSDSDDDR